MGKQSPPSTTPLSDSRFRPRSPVDPAGAPNSARRGSDSASSGIVYQRIRVGPVADFGDRAIFFRRFVWANSLSSEGGLVKFSF